MSLQEPLTIALIALAIVRTVGAVVFADAWRRSNTPAHRLLMAGWFLLAAGSVTAVVLGGDTPFFPALATSGMTMVAGGALQYFRPLRATSVSAFAGVAAVAILLASAAGPNGAGATGSTLQALILIAAVVALFRGGPEFRSQAPRAYGWLVAVCVVGATHAIGFTTLYPGPPEAPAILGTVLLSAVALLFFLELEMEISEKALVRSNERFRATFEQAAVGIVHVSAEMRFLRVNSKFAEMTGYSKQELLRQMTVSDVTHPDDRGQSEARTAKVRTGELRETSFEKRYLRKDGSLLWGAVTVSAVRAEDGSLEYLIAVIRDVTERKRLESEVEQHRAHLEDLVAERTDRLWAAYRELKLANRTKSDFLAKMSHELRTPLNSIIGFTDLILGGLTGPINEEQQRQLAMVRLSGEHLLSLVNDVLDIEKIEAGHAETVAGRFDVCELLGNVFAIVKPLAEAKGLGLTEQCDVRDPLVNTDSQALMQILVNLLGNAIKFTDSGGVHMAVRATDHQIHIEVHDTGRGIAEEDLARIFEPFTKGGEPDDAALQPGTGLGLSIAERLTELLGGKLWAESAPGTGSTFTLEIPRDLESAV